MTSHSPMTYDDFISQVEVAMLPHSPLQTEFETANSNFKFKDIEVGKIYVFWTSHTSNPSIGQIWFISPYNIQNEHNYSLYWCYYATPREGKPREGITKQSRSPDAYGGPEQHDSWVGYVWSGRRWKVLENNILPFNPFINWKENPLEVKQ